MEMNSRRPVANLGRSVSTLFGPYDDLAVFSSPNMVVFFLVTLAYFIGGKLGQQLAIPNPSATAFWPPTGIALAALFLKGKKALPGIFAGAFLVNVSTTKLVSISLGIALGNTLEAVVGVFLVNRFANGTRAFFHPRDVLRYAVLAGILPTVCCAVSGTSMLCLGGAAKWSGFWDVWSVWWVGDFLGAIILAPFLILLLGHRHNPLGWVEWLEASALLACLTTVCVLNFGPPLTSWMPKLFLSIPFLTWAAVRFCPLEVSGACLVMSSFAVWGSLHGYGPYANTRTAPLMAAGYASVHSIMTMFVAAALFKQRKEIEYLYTVNYGTESVNPGGDRTDEGSTESRVGDRKSVRPG
jgi:integral membrane sensor domain MASE1